MLKYTLFFLLLLNPFTLACAAAGEHLQQTDIYFADQILYCDVQTFHQEAYVLQVLAGGSSLTISWQFELQEKQKLWFNTTVASVTLGRQIIPDLVTKRWLMRDLSGGLVRYTSDVHTAMLFLTAMEHVAVLDASLLAKDAVYVLQTKIYMDEGEEQAKGWSSWLNWGDMVGEVDFTFGQGKAIVDE